MDRHIGLIGLRAVLLFSILFISVNLFAQSQLVRGPYLNMGTPSSMVVRWRTVGSEIGGIAHGTAVGNLTDTVWESSATTEHELQVAGLAANTKYYYTVLGSGQNLTPVDPSYYFQTSPVAGTDQPIRIWAIGDFGNGSQAQLDVKTGYTEHFGDVHTDVWMWLGDNAYGDGTDEEFQEKVFEVYPEVFKNSVVWPTPGNHDYGSVDLFNNGPYYEILTLPTNGEAGGVPSGEEGYYSFDYGNIHFLSLNTEYVLWIAFGGTAFQDWLEQDLQNTTANWTIVFFHQPPYSKGTHDSDDAFSRPEMMRQNVLPLLEEYGVDLVLNGHSHSYERSYLINGHYGNSGTWDPATMLIDGSNGNPNEGNAYQKYYDGDDPNLGAVYSVVGCSGQKGDGTSPLNHPVMYMSTEDYHGSMVIDVNGMELNAKFIDTTGTVLDEFAIIKSAGEFSSVTYVTVEVARMDVSPNPFQRDLTIRFNLLQAQDISIRIMDVKGNVIKEFATTNYTTGEHQLNYTPDQIPANGIYVVELQSARNLSVKRLVRLQ